MTEAKRSEYLHFALRLAQEAAKEILPRFDACDVSRREDGSVVTEADWAAETTMRVYIEERYPNHQILCEEGGASGGGGSKQWVLDPIDGTASFARGRPEFGTLVGLLTGGRPQLGVVHLPVTEETLFAEVGAGCWYRRGKVRRVGCGWTRKQTGSTGQ